MMSEQAFDFQTATIIALSLVNHKVTRERLNYEAQGYHLVGPFILTEM